MNKIDQERVHILREEPASNGPVVYWMSRDQRAADNWALLYAQEEALRRHVAMAVVFCLVPSFLDAANRHYRFMVQGLSETSTQLADKGIPFFLLQGDPGEEVPRFTAQNKVSLLVTDMDPLRIKQNWQRRVARDITCRLVEVDAHNVVPCRFVSPKQEFAARTLRPRIHRLLPRFLVPLPRVCLHPHAWRGKQTGCVVGEALLQAAGVGRCAAGEFIVAGPKAARAVLRRFVRQRLAVYDTARNDPTLAGQSDLSPYLHFGQISAQRVAIDVSNAAAPPDVSTEAFLEELIVRRELADNFCLHNPHYDSTAGFADWAKRTLSEHARDKRDYLYTLAQFEAAETHDPLWNAAQVEMMKRGKMHGFMRMYWGKKILEWTQSPEEAMDIALTLNNRYELDGRDPNGYAGVAWCIGGVHDRAWPSHNVFGKIRYMNANGCRRKFDVDGYIRMVNDL